MSIIRDGLYGFVIGDAMGVPVEFQSRSKLEKDPVTSMRGYGSYYDIPEGVWSDDSAMTLATLDSIILNQGKLDYNHLADCFCDWLKNGKYTATGIVFDVGITTKYALQDYMEQNKEAIQCGGSRFSENGNGSLMRMLPIAFYCYYQKLSDEEILDVIRKSSSITHAHEISIMGCYLYVYFILFLLQGKDKYQAYQLLKNLSLDMFLEENREVYSRILKEDIYQESLDHIQSSGYIVSTLEAVLWVILNKNSYRDSILTAVNLGEDTDTIGAITGSIAGILYGYESIDSDWIDKLKNKNLLEKIILDFEKTINIL